MGPTPEHGSRGKSHYAIGSSQCHVTPTGQRSDVCPLRPPRVGPLVWYTTQQAEQRRHGGLQDPVSECFPLCLELGHCSMQSVCRKGARIGLSPGHSITSSAATIKVGGTVRPSAFAVLILMTSSNFVGCTTGKSAGLAPLRIRPT